MLKRLIVGLVLGAIMGAAVAALLVQGLGVGFAGAGGAVIAYLAAASTGALTGLITGKPIWSATGKIEAGLKAFFGGLLALGAMFALRQWVHINLDLTSLQAGAGEVGQLPAASLPLIAALLGGFFELDNTSGSADAKDDEGGKSDKGASSKKVRVADEEDAEEEEEEASEPAKKRR